MSKNIRALFAVATLIAISGSAVIAENTKVISSDVEKNKKLENDSLDTTAEEETIEIEDEDGNLE